MLLEKKQVTPLIRCLFIFIVALFAFLPSLDNGFVDWDEKDLLLENPLVQEQPFSNIKEIFTTATEGRYYPLTMLVYQVEYFFFRSQPLGYHIVDLFLHLINVALVFMLLGLLGLNATVVFLTTLFFAIHPMQVESVAWAASLKDVLFVCFYLLAMIFYVKGKRDFTSGCVSQACVAIFFLLALCAKSMAVTLPAVLLLIDVYFDKKLTFQKFAQKIPLFILAFMFSMVAIKAAEGIAGFPLTKVFSVFDRVLLSSLALCVYIAKIFVPLRLSCLYPFPKPWEGLGPWDLYLSLVAVAGFMFLFVHKKGCWQKGRLAFLFFLVTLLPVLHLVEVNTSFIYERFVYLPSIGFFLLLAIAWEAAMNHWGKRFPAVRYGVKILLVGFVGFLWIATFTRCLVWKNSLTLWDDAVSKFPQSVSARISRGNALSARGQQTLAFIDFDVAVAIRPTSALAYFNRAGMYANVYKNYERAIEDYTSALQHPFNDPTMRAKTYLNRGLVYTFQRRFDLALQDYEKVVNLEPQNKIVRLNRAIVYYKQGRNQEALVDIEIILENFPKDYLAQEFQEKILKKQRVR